jgi:hypothetical protein
VGHPAGRMACRPAACVVSPPALYRAFCRLNDRLVDPVTAVADKEASLVDFVATQLWRLPELAARPRAGRGPRLDGLAAGPGGG